LTRPLVKITGCRVLVRLNKSQCVWTGTAGHRVRRRRALRSWETPLRSWETPHPASACPRRCAHRGARSTGIAEMPDGGQTVWRVAKSGSFPSDSARPAPQTSRWFGGHGRRDCSLPAPLVERPGPPAPRRRPRPAATSSAPQRRVVSRGYEREVCPIGYCRRRPTGEITRLPAAIVRPNETGPAADLRV
jgi:hypothetical protein